MRERLRCLNENSSSTVHVNKFARQSSMRYQSVKDQGLWDYVQAMELRFDRKIDSLSQRLDVLIGMFTAMHNSQVQASPLTVTGISTPAASATVPKYSSRPEPAAVDKSSNRHKHGNCQRRVSPPKSRSRSNKKRRPSRSPTTSQGPTSVEAASTFDKKEFNQTE